MMRSEQIPEQIVMALFPETLQQNFVHAIIIKASTSISITTFIFKGF